MSPLKSSIRAVVTGGMLALFALGCSESNRNTSPVDLIGTATLESPQINIAAPPSASAVADILLRTLVKNPSPVNPTDPRFLDVRVNAYRVSYIRTDGGTLVPQPFTLSSGQIIPAEGANVELDNFIAFQPGAFSSAPFAALLPQNGGVDPQTGRRTIDMDVRVEVFGETLQGDNVYTSVRFPVTFFYSAT